MENGRLEIYSLLVFVLYFSGRKQNRASKT